MTAPNEADAKEVEKCGCPFLNHSIECTRKMLLKNPRKWGEGLKGQIEVLIQENDALKAELKAVREGDICPACATEFEAGTFKKCGGSVIKEVTELIGRNAELEATLRLIATPKRADGTYNRSREACERLAREALGVKGECPCGSTTSKGCSVTGCPLYLQEIKEI